MRSVRCPNFKKPHLAGHPPSACSGVKACPWLEQGALRNTSAAKRQAAKLCWRFGPLPPSARSGNLIAGDGTKNGFSLRTKKPATNQKELLDTKSPIQVRIHPPPARSLRTIGSGASGEADAILPVKDRPR